MDEDASFREIVDLMELRPVGAVPVVDGYRRVVGIISGSDLLPKVRYAGEDAAGHIFEGRDPPGGAGEGGRRRRARPDVGAVPGALPGPPVNVGSLRGTALVVLVVAVPTLVAGMIVTARGSARGPVLWLGAVVYLLYNAVMFCFATPLNRFFLLYVATLALALWSVAAVLWATDLRSMADRISPRLPARAVAAYMWVVVVLNALAWLGRIVPALHRGDPQSQVEGIGVATNPVYVQDLAGWLPAAAVAAWWLWRRRPAGVLVVGALLTMWVIEGLSGTGTPPIRAHRSRRR